MGEKCRATGEECEFCAEGGSCLDGIRMFQDLPAEAKRELLSHVTQSSYPQGSVLVHRGDPIEAILIVRTGRIKTFRIDQDGEEYVLDVLHDGQAIWHGMFAEEASVYHYSVACLTPVTLCRIDRSDFEDLLASHPDLALRMIRLLGAELDEAEEKIAIISIRDPRRRLAEYLLYRDHRCMGAEIHLRLNDIANSVGLRPETVSRTLSAFERDGMIRRLGRGRLELLDRAALRDVTK